MDLLVSGLAAAVFLWFAGQLCEERPLMTHGLRLHPGLPLGSSDSYYLNQHCCLPNLRLQEPAQGLDPRTMTGASYGTAGVRKTRSCSGRHLLLGMVLTLGFLTKRKTVSCSATLPACLQTKAQPEWASAEQTGTFACDGSLPLCCPSPEAGWCPGSTRLCRRPPAQVKQPDRWEAETCRLT